MTTPLEATFWVLSRNTDLYHEAAETIRSHYADQTAVDQDWVQQPPVVPPHRILEITWTGRDEIDLEDGQPTFEALVRWEET